MLKGPSHFLEFYLQEPYQAHTVKIRKKIPSITAGKGVRGDKFSF